MKFCKVLIGPIVNEHGQHWPPQIVELNDNDATVLAEFKFVEILAVQPVPEPESPTEPEIALIVDLNTATLEEEPEIALIVDLNTATLEEMQTLPHVGPAIAQKLLENRPYASLEEARVASGLTMAKWAEIEALVVAAI